MEVFLKKVFLKMSQNSQENTCIGVSFLSAASNSGIVFPEPLIIFAKSLIIDVRLGYKYTSVLPPDLKPIYKAFFCDS